MPLDTLGSLSISAVAVATEAQKEFQAISVLRHVEGSLTMHVLVGGLVFNCTTRLFVLLCKSWCVFAGNEPDMLLCEIRYS